MVNNEKISDDQIKDKKGRVVGHAHYIYQTPNDDYMQHYMNHLIDVKSRAIPLSADDQRYDEDDPFLLDSVLLAYSYAGIHTKEGLYQMYKGLFRKAEELHDDIFEDTHQWLVKHRFLDEKTGLCTKFLGEKVCRFAIKPKTALHFVQIRAILNQYNKPIDYPTLFALILMTEEFTDNIRVNPDGDSTDALAVSVGSRFIKTDQIYEILQNNEYLQSVFEPRKNHLYKAFCMTYHVYLEDIGILSKDEKSANYIPCNSADTSTIRMSAERIMNAGALIVGTNWSYGDQVSNMFKGILMSTPTFEPNILELCNIDGMGMKTAQALIELKINSLVKLSVISPAKLAEAMRKLRAEGKIGMSMSEERATTFRNLAKLRLKELDGKKIQMKPEPELDPVLEPKNDDDDNEDNEK